MADKKVNAVTTESQKSEEYIGIPVPLDKRQPWTKPALVWLGFCFSFANLVIGGQIQKMVGMPYAIWAILLGNLGLFIYCSLIAVIGARTGFSFAMQVKATFGEKGALIPVMILSVFVCWCFAYNSWILTDVFRAVLGGNPVVWALVVVNLCWIATLAYKYMVVLGKAVVPIIIFLILYFLVAIVFPAGTRAIDSPAVNPTLFMAAFSIAIGTFTISGTMTSDIVRFCKKGSHSLLVMFVAFFIGNSFCLILGALASAASPGIDDYFGMTAVLGGIPLIICTLISQASTAASCLYNAVSGFCNLFKKLSWTTAVIASGVICSILAATGIIANLQGFFGTVGIIVPPIGGVLISDYYIVRKAQGYGAKTSSGINWYSLITVIVCVGLSFASARLLPSFPNQLTGILSAILIYGICGRAALKSLASKDDAS